MFKIVKVSELSGTALDWAVAKCEGVPEYLFDKPWRASELLEYYSTDWAQGGPIIEREYIAASRHDILGWASFQSHTAIGDVIYKNYFGPTLLIAAMRCYVASKLGDEVEIPQELL
jgi:hypothetical protein